MRDPNRLDNIYDEIKRIHKTYFPDWRWTQLMLNFNEWMWHFYGDQFYLEDDEILARWYELCGEKKVKHEKH